MSDVPRLAQPIKDGLDRAMNLEVGHGDLTAALGYSTQVGAWAQVEGEYHPTQALSLYALAQWTPSESQVGAGVKLKF